MVRRLLWTALVATFVLPVAVAFSSSGGSGYVPACPAGSHREFDGYCVHTEYVVVTHTRTLLIPTFPIVTTTETLSTVVTVGGGTTTVPGSTQTATTSVPGSTTTTTAPGPIYTSTTSVPGSTTTTTAPGPIYTSTTSVPGSTTTTTGTLTSTSDFETTTTTTTTTTSTSVSGDVF
jgi:hypothetical protein